jgi:hypothetical protein
MTGTEKDDLVHDSFYNAFANAHTNAPCFHSIEPEAGETNWKSLYEHRQEGGDILKYERLSARSHP